jgi:hypothetical protein
MKSINEIKSKINELHQSWLEVGESLHDFKNAEYYEGFIIDLLLNYCKENKYEVEGFPFRHELLAKTDENIDSDYFSERYDLYLYRLANEKDDVFELLHYYWNLFWPDSIENTEDTKNSIEFEISDSELDFKI